MAEAATEKQWQGRCVKVLDGSTVVMADTAANQKESDFRKGERLGKNDHIVTWNRPKRRPKAMNKEEFEALPATLQVREVRFSVEQPGWRTKSVTVVTTLLDAPGLSQGQTSRTLWAPVASGDQSRSYQDHFGDGDAAGTIDRIGAQGNLCSPDGL